MTPRVILANLCKLLAICHKIHVSTTDKIEFVLTQMNSGSFKFIIWRVSMYTICPHICDVTEFVQ